MPRGGKRAGAGRPTDLARQEHKLTVVSKRLKEEIIPSLGLIADNYPELIGMALEKARSGEWAALKWLLEFPLQFVQMEELPDTPITKLRESWTRTVTVEGAVAAKPKGPDSGAVIDAEYTTLP